MVETVSLASTLRIFLCVCGQNGNLIQFNLMGLNAAVGR